MKMKKIYQKLVRDRIPEIITEAGKDFSVTQLRGERLKDYGMKKLQEEVQEFVENPCAEEAADIMENPSAEEAADIEEILSFICTRMSIKEAAVRAQRISKRATKGGFDMGFLLEWVDDT